MGTDEANKWWCTVMMHHCIGHCELSLSSLQAFNMLTVYMYKGLSAELYQEHRAVILIIQNSISNLKCILCYHSSIVSFSWGLTSTVLSWWCDGHFAQFRWKHNYSNCWGLIFTSTENECKFCPLIPTVLSHYKGIPSLPVWTEQMWTAASNWVSVHTACEFCIKGLVCRI